MKTDSVYDEITVEELQAIAEVCGFASRIEHNPDGRHILWLRVAGDNTLLVVRGEGRKQSASIVHFFNTAEKPSRADRANDWNRENGFATAYLAKEGIPCLDSFLNVRGVSREHVALQMFIWEANVESFLRHFG